MFHCFTYPMNRHICFQQFVVFFFYSLYPMAVFFRSIIAQTLNIYYMWILFVRSFVLSSSFAVHSTVFCAFDLYSSVFVLKCHSKVIFFFFFDTINSTNKNKTAKDKFRQREIENFAPSNHEQCIPDDYEMISLPVVNGRSIKEKEFFFVFI